MASPGRHTGSGGLRRQVSGSGKGVSRSALSASIRGRPAPQFGPAARVLSSSPQFGFAIQRHVRTESPITRLSASADDAPGPSDEGDGEGKGGGFNMGVLSQRIAEMREREVLDDKECARNWREGRCTHHTVAVLDDYVRHLKMHGDALACGTFGGDSFVIEGLVGRGTPAGPGEEAGRDWATRPSAKAIRRFEGHTEEVTAVDFDGTHLVTGSQDNTARLWTVPKGPIVEEEKDEELPPGLELPPGPGLGVAVHNDKSVDCKVLAGHGAPVTEVQLMPGQVVTASLDGTFRLFDRATGALQHAVNVGVAVTSLHHTGEYVIVGTGSGQVAAYTAGNEKDAPKLLLQFEAHPAPVTCLRLRHDTAFNQDMLFTAAGDGMLRSWDFAAGGSPIRTFHGHRAEVVSLCFDQTKLVSAAKDGSIRVWDLRSGEGLFGLWGHTAYITSVQFDRTRLISDGTNNVLSLHDFAAGAPARGDEGNDLDC